MKSLKDIRVRVSRSRSCREHGQSSLEYVVVCAALVFALGISMADDTSVLKQLIEAFKTAYEKISFALSLPM
jgi:hypothetical protein